MCVACSKGKSLPPKYGKVARTVVAPKVSLTSGGTLQRASENPTMKDNSQEVAADGTVINKNSSEANMIVHNSDRLSSRCSKERTDHHVVDWVGEPLKVVENKTYYYSCNIDGIAYNLEDHILIASKDRESAPSKLQSLWEEHDSRSKLAMVNPYLFASDVPELICKPCTSVKNEVFLAHVRCCMLTSLEETKKSQVVSSKLRPIFFCRWKYDESASSFSGVDR
ncbi:hypothetical protein GUJ93_ZPchr0006g45139 [Zizania palustris]|uniref:BAH domain-containing protein n=1 Tax=Zizania palustris TaxID=103762 RepID=A0A8J5T1X4_ZIZPA|nr:hypothetical protein GUJ93_ZPchr0006g45139 [Zizania palustris]